MAPDPVLLWVVHLALAVLVVETGWLVVHYRRDGRSVALQLALGQVVAGLFLLLALRVVIIGASEWQALLYLAAAGLAHGWELWRRFKLDRA